MSTDLIRVKAISNLSPKVKAGDIGWAALKDFNEKMYFDVQFHGSTLKDVMYTLLEKVDGGKETQKPKKVYFMLKNLFCHEKLKNNFPYKGKLNADGSIACEGYTFDEFNEHFMQSITKQQYKALKLARIRAEIEEEVRAEHDEALKNLREEMKSFAQKFNSMRQENENLKKSISKYTAELNSKNADFLYWKHEAERQSKAAKHFDHRCINLQNENETLKELNDEWKSRHSSMEAVISIKDEAYKKLLAAMDEAQETIKQKQLVIDGFIGDEFHSVGHCSHSAFTGKNNITTIEIFNCDFFPEQIIGKEIYIK